MKDKILSGLKQAFSSKYGVSDEVLQGYANSLAATGLVTDENLATVIQGQEPALRAYQTNFDRERKKSSDLEKELKELKEKKVETPSKEEKAPLTAEDIAKVVSEVVKPFSDKLTQLETQTAAEKRNAEILGKAKEHGVPEIMVSRFNIPSDANLDDYMKNVKQDLANIGFKDVKPESGNEVKESEAIAGMIGEGTKKIVESKKE